MRKNFTYRRISRVMAWLFIITIFIGIKAKAGNTYTAKHPAPADYKLWIEIKPDISLDTSIKNNINVQSGAVYPVIYTNLLVYSANSLFLTDGVAAAFDNNFSASVDGYDAIKLWNFGENIALARDNVLLAAEFRPVPMLSDTLFYRLYLKQQPYALQLFTQNFSGMPPMRTWLVDNYLNTKTEINLYDTSLYNFTPNPDTLSYRNRFMLVFDRQSIATPVPVTKIISQQEPNVTGISNSMSVQAAGINVYPNPVSNGKPMLRFAAMDKGSYSIAIYNAKGQKFGSYTIQHNGGNAVYALQTSTGLKPGIYAITIFNQMLKKTISLKLVVNG